MLALSDKVDVVMTCPRCGGKLRRRSASFPRCPQCRELLVTCRYCLHYDRTVLDCGHPLLHERMHVSDPDLFTLCPYHASSLAGKTPLPVRSRLIRLGVAAAILMVFASLFAVSFRIVPRVPEPRLFMSVAVPEQVTEGEATRIGFLIWNAGEEPVKRVVLALNATYLRKFIPQSTSPEPTEIVPTSSTRYYYFGPLQPGQDFRVEMALIAKRSGTHRFKAQLFSEHGLEQREDRDTTILP